MLVPAIQEKICVYSKSGIKRTGIKVDIAKKLGEIKLNDTFKKSTTELKDLSTIGKKNIADVCNNWGSDEAEFGLGGYACFMPFGFAC